MEWDVFVSYAHEDKDTFVRPLVEMLSNHGLKIWFDDTALMLGDSLRRSIDRGLRESRYGIVVLSKSYFSKEWTQWELDGLLSRNLEEGKVILPIWHGVTKTDVKGYSPSLADKVAVDSARGLDNVTQDILRVIKVDRKDSTAKDKRSRLPLVNVFKSSVSYGANPASFMIENFLGPEIQDEGLTLIIEPLSTSDQFTRKTNRDTRYKVTTASYDPLLIIHEVLTVSPKSSESEQDSSRVEVTVQARDHINHPFVDDLLKRLRTHLINPPSISELYHLEELYGECLQTEKIKEAWEEDPFIPVSKADAYDRASEKYEQASMKFDDFISLMKSRYPNYSFELRGSWGCVVDAPVKATAKRVDDND